MEWVLVTGGAGYIGTNTIVELIEAGYRVVCVDNFFFATSAGIDRVKSLIRDASALVVCVVDVRDPVALDGVFKRHRITRVIHFAGLKSVAESVRSPLEYYDTNVVGTATLLKTMLKHNVKRMVFSSSATVYGVNNVSPLVETMSCVEPANPYGRTKLHVEHMLRDVCASDPDFQAIILRYFNPIGAHSSGLLGDNPIGAPNNLMPYLIQVASKQRPILSVFGGDYPTPDGTAERDYIHVTDVADGHVAALAFKERGAHVFNLGTGQPVSVLQLVRRFQHVTGVSVDYSVVERRPGDVASVYSDPSKANGALGWKATRTLDDMCTSAWAASTLGIL